MRKIMTLFTKFSIAFIICNAIGLGIEPEVIFEDITFNYNPNFVNAGKNIYFNARKDSAGNDYYLWQTDGTIEGTKIVNALDETGTLSNIKNPIDINFSDGILFFKTVLDKKNYLGIYNLETNKYKILNEMDITSRDIYNHYPPKFFGINVLMWNPNEFRGFAILNKNDFSFYYNPDSNIVNCILAKNDKIIVFSKDSTITFINGLNWEVIWKKKTSNYVSGCILTKDGLLTYSGDGVNNRLLIDYNDGSFSYYYIPNELKLIDFDNRIFSIFFNEKTYIVKSDSSFNVTDTLLSEVFGNKSYNDLYFYFIPSKKHTYFRKGLPYTNSVLFDLYSYSTKTGNLELIVKECMNTNLDFFNEFPNGKKLMKIHTQKYGNELFTTDGTTIGTHILKDIYPGPASSSDDYGFDYNIIYKKKNYTFKIHSDKYDYALWKTDGTEENTYPIFSYYENKKYNYYNWYLLDNNKLLSYLRGDGKSQILSYQSHKLDEVKKTFEYKIIENIYSYSRDDINQIYIGNILKDKYDNFFISGFMDVANVRYPFIYKNEGVTDTTIRDWRTAGYIIKYDKSGKRQFTKYINYDMFGKNFKTSIDSNDNIFCLFNDTNPENGSYDYAAILKMNNNCDSLWQLKFYPSRYSEIKALQTDKYGNSIIVIQYFGYSLNAGKFMLTSSISPELAVFKISPQGEILKATQLYQTEYFDNVQIAIIDNRIYITLSEVSANWTSSCKYKNFYNSIFLLDTDLNIIKSFSFSGDDFNYITSIHKGIEDELFVAGTYRGNLNLGNKILNSDNSEYCNLQTSYFAYFDLNLNLKYVRDLNPEKYVVNSTFISNDVKIYSAGICEGCTIDSVTYPNKSGYTRYNDYSVGIKQFDYFGTEQASFYYSKRKVDYSSTKNPQIIELDGMPLIYDVYMSNLGYLPDAYHTQGHICKILLMQPVLLPVIQNNNRDISSKYAIESDNSDNHFLIAKSFDKNKEISITFYDLKGRFLYTYEAKLFYSKLKLFIPSGFYRGCYIVVIKDRETTEQHKLMY